MDLHWNSLLRVFAFLILFSFTDEWNRGVPGTSHTDLKDPFFPSPASSSLVGRRRGDYLFAGYCILHFTSFWVVIVDKIPPHRLCSQCKWEGVGFYYLCLQLPPVARHVALLSSCRVGIFTVVSLHCLCSD